MKNIILAHVIQQQLHSSNQLNFFYWKLTKKVNNNRVMGCKQQILKQQQSMKASYLFAGNIMTAEGVMGEGLVFW